MSITDWFKARENKRYTETSAARSAEQSAGRSKPSEVPDGVWQKCPSCKAIVYQGELDANLQVCAKCAHHFDVSAASRIEYLVDEGSFEETDPHLRSTDPLEFEAGKSYVESLERAREKSGLDEAVITGRARIGGHPVAIAAMDFRFIGASMGSVVGEKVTRVFEIAVAERRSVVVIAASGGARMQEGMLSLMQMAKTAAAAQRLAEAGLPYVSILTNPTFGGVTASFAVLADVILAEPGAIVGFTGPRVIEQTIRQSLPKGFQSSEFLLKHGMVDEVVPRGELADRVRLVLDYLEGGEY